MFLSKVFIITFIYFFSIQSIILQASPTRYKDIDYRHYIDDMKVFLMLYERVLPYTYKKLDDLFYFQDLRGSDNIKKADKHKNRICTIYSKQEKTLKYNVELSKYLIKKEENNGCLSYDDINKYKQHIKPWPHHWLHKNIIGPLISHYEILSSNPDYTVDDIVENERFWKIVEQNHYTTLKNYGLTREKIVAMHLNTILAHEIEERDVY